MNIRVFLQLHIIYIARGKEIEQDIDSTNVKLLQDKFWKTQNYFTYRDEPSRQ